MRQAFLEKEQRRIHMLITTADFRANMDKYLAMVHHEDIFITLENKALRTIYHTKIPLHMEGDFTMRRVPQCVT